MHFCMDYQGSCKLRPNGSRAWLTWLRHEKGACRPLLRSAESGEALAADDHEGRGERGAEEQDHRGDDPVEGPFKTGYERETH